MSDSYGEIAQRQRGMTPIRVTLAAGVPQRFPIEGDWVHCLTAPAGVNDLYARFDQSEPVPLPQGVGFRRYYKIIELESATGGAFLVLGGFGSVADARATVNANVTTTVAPGNTMNNGGDVATLSGAATQLLAADPDRLYAIISNPSSNSATVRIGNATVGAADGAPLEPGETITVGTTAALYGYQASGGPVTISAASVSEV